MAYLGDFDHDAFVSYAHTKLDFWSKEFVTQLQRLVSIALGPEAEENLHFWIDDETEGNVPLSEGLKQKVDRSAILIVLLTHRYLNSEWCQRELAWFEHTIKKKTQDLKQPVFIVHLQKIERTSLPPILRELPGYDFVGDGRLNLPKGYSLCEEKPRGEDYSQAATKTAVAIVDLIKSMKAREKAVVKETGKSALPSDEPPTGSSIGPSRDLSVFQKRPLYLAAVPEECVGLRRKLVTLLADTFDIVPFDNPLDPLVVRKNADIWARRAKIFVQVIGNSSGVWPDGNSSPGLVVFQNRVAEMQDLQIHSFLSPRVEPAEIDDPAHLALVNCVRRNPPETLELFARQIVGFENSYYESRQQSVFLVPDGDKPLEISVRQAMRKLGIVAYPFETAARDPCSLNELNKMKLTRTLRSSQAILLLFGEKGKRDPDWLYEQYNFIVFRLGEFGHPPRVAIIDGPPDHEYPEKVDSEPPDPAIFWNDKSEFGLRISKWFASTPESRSEVV